MNAPLNKSVTNAFNIGTKKDYREETDKNKEKAFICELLGNKRLYVFGCTILFLIIQHGKKIGFSYDDIASVIEAYNVGKIILKLGYSKKQANEIIGIANLGEFIAYNESNHISFMQLMGAFYRFQSNNIFVKLCIDNDIALQTDFMNAVRTYFKLPGTMEYDKYKVEIIDKSYGFWFYLWVVTFLMSEKKNFMHRSVVNDPDYIRLWDKSVEFSAKRNESKYKSAIIHKDDCKYAQLDNFEDKSLVIGNTFMVPRENGIWFNQMRYYKKEIIAGPSSSAVLTYQIIFDISKILEPTDENKIMLLLCILCHYSEYYHSFSEILQTYTVDASLIEYTLDMNDLDYILQISANVLGNIGGGKRTKRRKTRRR